MDHLLDSQMAITLELKHCLSYFSTRINRKKKKTKLTHFSQCYKVPKLIPYFGPIFASFQNEADRLSFNSLIGSDQKVIMFDAMI